MVAPVDGLRPSRAERSDTEKVPNPISDTRPPEDSVLEMLLVTESSAFLAAALEMPASAAIASMSSALFIVLSFIIQRNKYIGNTDSYKSLL